METVVKNGTTVAAGETYKADIAIKGARSLSLARTLRATRSLMRKGTASFPAGRMYIHICSFQLVEQCPAMTLSPARWRRPVVAPLPSSTSPTRSAAGLVAGVDTRPLINWCAQCPQ